MNPSENILFKSTEEISGFLPAPIGMNFDLVLPIIESAQTQWITPIIGSDELANLLTKYHDGITATLANEEIILVRKIQYPLAQMTFLNAIPLLNLNITSGGITVRNSEDSVPASKARTDELKRQLSINAQRGLDLLLAYLEENSADHQAYEGSQERLSAKENFINTASEASTFLGISIGHFVFKQMRPVITRLEEYQFKTILCDDLYDHIKDKVKNRQDLEDYAPLLPLIQRALIHLAFSAAIDEIGVTVDERGIYISMDKAFETTQREETSLRGGPSTAMGRRNYEIGVKALEQLKAELDANAATYPLYENSPCYQSIQAVTNEQTEGSGIFNGL